MRICTILLDKSFDDTAHGFLDTTRALLASGHFVGVVTHPKAAVNTEVDALNVSQTTFKSPAVLDNAAYKNLGAFIRTLRADVVLAFGERAVQAARKALHEETPLIAVVQEYQFQYLYQADAVFALTQHMMDSIHQEVGISKERMYLMPGMITMDTGGFIRRTWREPPVIGARGECSPRAGFDIWLQALALLKAQGHAFRARLAATGEEVRALKKLSRQLELEGWVEFLEDLPDPESFYESLDLFCFPPHHEPFGRILLEAMAQKLPVVTTDAEGPSEIIVHQHSGLIVPRADAKAMAEALAVLLADESYARDLAGNAWRSVKQHYEAGRIAAHLSEVLAYLCACHEKARITPREAALS